MSDDKEALAFTFAMGVGLTAATLTIEQAGGTLVSSAEAGAVLFIGVLFIVTPLTFCSACVIGGLAGAMGGGV